MKSPSLHPGPVAQAELGEAGQTVTLPYLGALYDTAEKEVSRQDRATIAGFQRKLLTGEVDEKMAVAAGLALAGKDKNLQAEVLGLFSRDVPVDQSVDDVKVLLRQRLVNRLESAQRLTRPARVYGELVGTGIARDGGSAGP